MPVGATIGAVGSAASAYIGSKAAKKAAGAQQDAAMNALNLQQQMFQTAQQNLSPFMDVGTNAAYTLAGFYGLPTPAGPHGFPASAGGQPAIQSALANFTQTPDYQFAFQQGQRALEAGLAKRGGTSTGGGGYMQEAQQFGQGLASQQFGNYFNRLFALTQLGAQSAGQSGNLASNFAQMGTQSWSDFGNAKASGIVGSANAITGGIDNIAQYALLPQKANLLQSMYQSSQSSYGTPMVGNPWSGKPGVANVLDQSGNPFWK